MRSSQHTHSHRWRTTSGASQSSESRVAVSLEVIIGRSTDGSRDATPEMELEVGSVHENIHEWLLDDVSLHKRDDGVHLNREMSAR